mgnify:CR=1 FL=1
MESSFAVDFIIHPRESGGYSPKADAEGESLPVRCVLIPATLMDYRRITCPFGAERERCHRGWLVRASSLPATGSMAPSRSLPRLASRPTGSCFAQGEAAACCCRRDGPDGLLPLEFGFRFPGDEYPASERAASMALLERFELPSLRQLIDKGASVTVWMHRPDGGDPARAAPHATDLRLRLHTPLRHDEAGIYGFDL